MPPATFPFTTVPVRNLVLIIIINACKNRQPYMEITKFLTICAGASCIQEATGA